MEYVFDAFTLWAGRLVFLGAILLALVFIGIGVANLSIYLMKLFKGNNRQATQLQREMFQHMGMYFALRYLSLPIYH